MIMQYSPDGHLLYLRLRDGDVAGTAEIEDDVYVDLDPDGRPLGVEFVNADAFFPFRGCGRADRAEMIEIPRDLESRLEQLLAERTAVVAAARTG